MLIYWMMFAPAAALSVVERSGRWTRGFSRMSLEVIFVVLLVIIGSRHQVGGDWGPYLRMSQSFESVSITQALFARSDIGYMSINLASYLLGTGIWGVNFACAAIFLWGLRSFALQQPRPALVLMQAVPYLVIVVAMGYTRQAVAIGILLYAITFIERRALVPFILSIGVACTFHSAAILMLPIGLMAIVRRPMPYLVAGLVICFVGSFIFEAQIARLMRIYISGQANSSGALIRLLYGALFAVAFLIGLRKAMPAGTLRRFWTICAVMQLVLLVLLPVFPSSTVLDRAALYLIPLQLYVVGTSPERLRPYSRLGGIVLLILLNVLTLFVWLNYADNAVSWLPYTSALL